MSQNQSNLDAKTRERMRKLLALAERGEGGEAVNAERFLVKLLAKHGMTMADLSSQNEERQAVEFKYKTDAERRVILQIASKVLDTLDVPVFRYRSSKGRQVGKVIVLELTAAERAEVHVYLGVLKPALERHLDLALSAFIQANALYPSPSHAGYSDKGMSREQLASLAAMIAGTERVSVLTALPGKSAS